ncbi:glycosyltransferase [Oxalobacteraceae bacterium OM1]|nr:glycosyltransferase [Oxalobacteraceae bacterium OM1]
MGFTFWLSLAVLVIVLATLIEVVAGASRIRDLADHAPSLPGAAPKISIVVSALNEAETIEPALRSLLALDYPDLEIIAIDDRSTDATPAILDRLAADNPHLRVLHIRELPPGWLGKNHALHLGAQHASGEYLIFTDADVVFEPSALRRAVHCCAQERLDHLAILIDVVARSPLLQMLMLTTMIGFMMRFKPWKVASSEKHFIGVGAFNMVRRDTYLRIGGHAAIPLEVIDDMELGRLVKRKGGRQQALTARGLVHVEWYTGAGQMIRGMEKNVFAAFEYQLWQPVMLTLIYLPMRIWPWVALFVTSGATFWLNVATLGATLIVLLGILNVNRWGWRCLLYWPVVGFVELWLWWRNCLLVLVRGGIDWRGTRYPLETLRRAHKG